MSINILMMLDSLWKSCVIWLDVRGKPFQIVCSTMQPAYEEHDTTGSSNGADSLPWLTRLVCPLYSLPTVQLSSNGQNCLICPDDTKCNFSRNKTVLENPAIADCFFYHRIQKFIEAFYVGVLGTTDYWMRFEWQHRGSPHVHGLAWLSGAPDVEQIVADGADTAKEELIRYVDKIVTTLNPAILPDGSNAPTPKTNPHICNKHYDRIEDFNQDLADLVATCQRHTRCSAAYCLCTRDGQQKCRFSYPKPLQPETTLVIESGTVNCTKRWFCQQLQSCAAVCMAPMWTCSIVYLVTRSLNTVQSMPPRVNLVPSQ